jgi:hypothetical protein
MPIDSIVELASQLQAFVNTKHPFASDLDLAIFVMRRNSLGSYAAQSRLLPLKTVLIVLCL